MRRRSPRKNVQWTAIVHFGAIRIPCTIVNISRHGAKLQLPADASLGTYGTIIIERHGAFEAELIWRRGEFAGIAFSDIEDTDRLAPYVRPGLRDLPRFGRRSS
jgi:hypothetical protein